MIDNMIFKILHHVDEYLVIPLTKYVNNNTNALRKKCFEKISLFRTYQYSLRKTAQQVKKI
jgi:hypothetical protein